MSPRILSHVAGIAIIGTLGIAVPASAAPHPAGCTHPAVVRDGLVELTCFPAVPAAQFPATAGCRHIDAWATSTSTETVNGQRYTITQRFRDDVWICR